MPIDNMGGDLLGTQQPRQSRRASTLRSTPNKAVIPMFESYRKTEKEMFDTMRSHPVDRVLPRMSTNREVFESQRAKAVQRRIEKRQNSGGNAGSARKRRKDDDPINPSDFPEIFSATDDEDSYRASVAADRDDTVRRSASYISGPSHSIMYTFGTQQQQHQKSQSFDDEDSDDDAPPSPTQIAMQVLRKSNGGSVDPMITSQQQTWGGLSPTYDDGVVGDDGSDHGGREDYQQHQHQGGGVQEYRNVARNVIDGTLRYYTTPGFTQKIVDEGELLRLRSSLLDKWCKLVFAEYNKGNQYFGSTQIQMQHWNPSEELRLRSAVQGYMENDYVPNR
eukprot:PhF_6_TR1995/c0_g1_i3/m.3367